MIDRKEGNRALAKVGRIQKCHKCRKCGEDHGSTACATTPDTLQDGFYICDTLAPLRPVLGPLRRDQLDAKSWHSSFSNLRIAEVRASRVAATWPYMGAVATQ